MKNSEQRTANSEQKKDRNYEEGFIIFFNFYLNP